MPKHNEDFSNAEQEEKNKFHGGQDLVPGALVRQKLSKCIFRQSYFSSDRGGKTRVMPKHNEDFSNDEQEEKNKYKYVGISSLTH